MKQVIVIKVGTDSLLNSNDAPELNVFQHVARDIILLSNEYRVVLVTSGAIGFGVRQMDLDERPENVEKLQALSMMGQVGLLRRWREALEPTTIGQVLVTRRELSEHTTNDLFVRSVGSLWGYGALPIVNENDAISSEEISFGDNDKLAAVVARSLRASKLVYLTNQDGIQKDFETKIQSRIKSGRISDLRQHLRPGKSSLGRGGAMSKITSAELALSSGVEVWIGDARVQNPITATLSGEKGTYLVE